MCKRTEHVLLTPKTDSQTDIDKQAMHSHPNPTGYKIYIVEPTFYVLCWLTPPPHTHTTVILCQSEQKENHWTSLARTRGAAYSNSRPQPGAKTFGGLEGGGGEVGRPVSRRGP